jgi:hypothetical protein
LDTTLANLLSWWEPWNGRAHEQATIRAASDGNLGGDKPILLTYDAKSGHMRVKPVNQAIEDASDSIGFLWHEVSK